MRTNATQSPSKMHQDYGPSGASSVALDAQHHRLDQLGASAVAAATSAPVSSEQHQHQHQHQLTQQQPSVDSTAYQAGKDYRGPQDDDAYWKSQTSNAANFLGMCPANIDNYCKGLSVYLGLVSCYLVATSGVLACLPSLIVESH